MPTTYIVNVKVTQPPSIGGDDVYFIQVSPERVLMNGDPQNEIVWIMEGELATFKSPTDVFFNNDGEGPDKRFVVTFENGAIRAKLNKTDLFEIIWTYELTVHVKEHNGKPPFAIKVDPEVDNPPPPRP
jgi:hypothetical protein